jgi:Flp pilus assembly protein TadG
LAGAIVTSFIRNERGSISIWLATASFVMMMLVGLAVDLGGQVHAKQRAHDVAAQAARAGGQRIQPAAAIEGRSVSVDLAAARAAALDFLDAADIDGTVTITGGDTVTVTVTDHYEPKFLGVIGITDLEVTGEASARVVRTIGGTEQ